MILVSMIINEMVDDLSKRKFDEVIYDNPEYSNTSIKTPVMPVAVDINPISGDLYASNRSNTIYTIDKDNKPDLMLKNITLQI